MARTTLKIKHSHRSKEAVTAFSKNVREARDSVNAALAAFVSGPFSWGAFALACFSLSTFEAAADACGFDRSYEADSVRHRFTNLIGLNRRHLEWGRVDLA